MENLSERAKKVFEKQKKKYEVCSDFRKEFDNFIEENSRKIDNFHFEFKVEVEEGRKKWIKKARKLVIEKAVEAMSKITEFQNDTLDEGNRIVFAMNFVGGLDYIALAVDNVSDHKAPKKDPRELSVTILDCDIAMPSKKHDWISIRICTNGNVKVELMC